MHKISIITPFKARDHCDDDKRLSNLLSEITTEDNIDFFIAEELPSTNFHFPHSNVFIHKMNSIPCYSAGVARNFVVRNIESEFIFFLDLDLLYPKNFINQMDAKKNKLGKSNVFFEMYPCLYLTKEETERFDGDFQGCLESFLRGENHRVEGIALASSCLLMNREWFLQLGGFDEQFVGHGGEDLELIDRLTRHYPIGPRPDDYALNIKAQHPGDYQGFRRYFSYYALPHLFAGRFLVHQWHPRPLTHPYHKRRAGNDQLLEQMLARTEAERGPLKGPVVPCNDLGGELPDFREWMIRLQEEAGYPVQEYPGLLRWQDGIKLKRPLWRKLRKLYLNPRAFFRDMFNPRSR
ncbi:galactosyltransferase-related protein [Aeromonas hydrophila]|uniref:galactosyltransferase-related protein n=1 Tax=Aeromonas hydrophila TaxID=644 RepID=UPI0030DA3967